jgi:hypothetical protein
MAALFFEYLCFRCFSKALYMIKKGTWHVTPHATLLLRKLKNRSVDAAVRFGAVYDVLHGQEDAQCASEIMAKMYAL